MKTRLARLSMASLLASVLLSIGLASLPSAFAVTPSGQVNYLNVSGSSCTSTAWTGPTASDGNVPGMFPNNVGGPPNTVVVGTGSVCIEVVLTGGTPNTAYTITATKMSGSLTVTTDGTGNGNNKAVFTSSFSGTCTTDPLKMSPDTPFGLTAGQINHVYVGTGSPCTTITHGVPQFPAGVGIMLMLVLPALLLLRKRVSLQP